jgi:hypothetical protein
MAERLAITIDEVNASPVPVEINGRRFMVQGIFESRFRWSSARDLDGRDPVAL